MYKRNQQNFKNAFYREEILNIPFYTKVYWPKVSQHLACFLAVYHEAIGNIQKDSHRRMANILNFNYTDNTHDTKTKMHVHARPLPSPS